MFCFMEHTVMEQFIKIIMVPIYLPSGLFSSVKY